jgi:proteasome regulatory subunit
VGKKYLTRCTIVDISNKMDAAIPVIFLEVTPMVLFPHDECAEAHAQCVTPFLTNFGIKEYLRRKSQNVAIQAMIGTPTTSDGLFLQWNQNNNNNQNASLVSRSSFNNIYLGGGYVIPSTDTIMHQDSPSLLPLINIPSEDPTVVDPQPCCMKAYAYSSPYRSEPISPILITEHTLVRILPLQMANLTMIPISLPSSTPHLPDFILRDLFLQDLSGEGGQDSLTESMRQEVLQNHNPETIRELQWKMANIMHKPIQIGTTACAIQDQKRQLHQIQRMQQSLLAYNNYSNNNNNKFWSDDVSLARATSIKSKGQLATASSSSKQRPELFWWPSLLVHSPNHADGKTVLVQAIAKNHLGCSLIHVIRPGVLLAKYGSQADAALETQLHAILTSAACRNERICIILDHIDMMMPPQLSGRSAGSGGDATLPVLTSMASYLRNVTSSMQRLQQFPFPIKNVLYNVGGGGGGGTGGGGQVLTVHCCLVGVVTCPDDGGKSSRRSKGMGLGGEATILDCMICDRYKIPILTPVTRLSAFDAAFRREHVNLDMEAQRHLPSMAASAVWAKGKAFRAVAQYLQQLQATNTNQIAVLQDLERAFASVKRDSSNVTSVSIELMNTTCSSKNSQESFFQSVGGNAEAKASLEDALAIDPFKRRLLAKFSLSPPTGVLLYGPPGCGKTLLAKAVANLLKSSRSDRDDDHHNLMSSGTFISLAISDVVSSELGTSEKMIKSSFELAEKNAPSVIFLDEFQALFVDRSRGGSGRLTTTLLQMLDDAKRWYDVDGDGRNRVTVIAATNTPWMIDSAFLRPGRFDRVVHVGLPSMEERKSILHLHISQMMIKGRDEMTIRSLSQKLARQTDGFSGADLAALCRAAAVRALSESSGVAEVTETHFSGALEMDIVPSSDAELVRRLSQWKP